MTYLLFRGFNRCPIETPELLDRSSFSFSADTLSIFIKHLDSFDDFLYCFVLK